MPHLNDVRLTLEILEAGLEERQSSRCGGSSGVTNSGMLPVVLEQRLAETPTA